MEAERPDQRERMPTAGDVSYGESVTGCVGDQPSRTAKLPRVESMGARVCRTCMRLRQGVASVGCHGSGGGWKGGW